MYRRSIARFLRWLSLKKKNNFNLCVPATQGIFNTRQIAALEKWDGHDINEKCSDPCTLLMLLSTHITVISPRPGPAVLLRLVFS